MTRFWPTVVVVWVMLAPGRGQEINLLRQPGFELAEGWRHYGADRYQHVPGHGRGGTTALRYHNPCEVTDPAENSHYDQEVVVTPDTLLVAGFWCRSSGDLRPTLRIAGMDWDTIALAAAKGTGDWELVQATFQTGSAEQVRFQIFAGAVSERRESAPGTVDIDDAFLRPPTAAEATAWSRPTITIRPDRVVAAVNPLFFGTNLLYSFDDDAALADGKLAARLREMGCRLLRYPGGEMADNYNWQTQLLEFPEKWPSVAGPATTDTDEFMAFCREVGAEPIFVVNVEAFTKQDRLADGVRLAAEWVRYCRDKGYPVIWWELGNETYLKGTLDPLTVRRYAAAVQAYAAAMRAVDPDIKLGVVGPFGVQAIGGGDQLAETGDRWWPTLVGLAGDSFDFVVVHRYATSSPLLVGQLRAFAGWLSEQRAGRRVEVALTEWNTAHPQQLHGMAQGLAIADLIADYLSGGVDLGCFWPLRLRGDQWGPRSLVTMTDGEPLASYWVMQLYEQRIGRRVVQAEVSAEQLIRVLATVSDRGEVALFATNRSPDRTLTAQVAAPGGAAQAWRLTAASPTAEPGPPAATTVELADGAWQWELAPMSVNALVIQPGG